MPTNTLNSPKRKVDHVINEWERLMSSQRRWHPLWIDATDFLAPRRSNITGWKAPAQRQTDRLFDSTGVHANTLLAASMQGALTSSASDWFGIRIRGLELAKDHAWSIALEQCARLMHDEIRQSNFSSEVHECYADLGALGQAALFEDERERKANQGWAGLRFMALTPGSYAIDEDGEGRVNLLYRLHQMSPRAAISFFGEDKASDAMRLEATKGDQNVPWRFIHGVFPREDFDPEKYGRLRTARTMPYVSCWVGERERRIMREGGYEEFPFFVPRWGKSTGEIYGRGPGFTALPDVKTLNKAVELKLKALAKTIDPPVKMRDDGVIGSVRLTPGGITHVRDMDAVDVLSLGGRIDIADMEEEKLRQNIRRIFFTDQLQLQEGPQMTAYEVQVRYELMQRILGPTLGRLETELLDPLINRTFWMLDRAGRFPHLPADLRRWLYQGHILDVVYEGPLARAARLSETVATQRFLQVILPVAQQEPDVMDNVDLDELIRDTAINTGVKMSILRSPEDRDAIRAAKARHDAEAQQAEQAAAATKSAGNAAPALQALVQAQKAGILPAPGAAISGPMIPQSP